MKLFGGGSEPEKQQLQLADLQSPPQSDRKRKSSELEQQAVVQFGFSPSPSKGRKPQRTLESFLGSPGPQLSVHRSPDSMMQLERYKQDQATRQQLLQAQSAELPGEWLVPVLQLPHSGGAKGGRPAVGPVRGVATGDRLNCRRVGQQSACEVGCDC